MTVWIDELHCFFVLDLTSKHSDVVMNLESVAVVSIFFVSKKLVRICTFTIYDLFLD